MAAINFTTDTLIQAVKDAIIVPNSQNLFQPVGILRYANREMANTIVPLILKCKGDYLTTTFDYTISESQNEYLIPSIATALKLMDVCTVDAQGNESNMALLSHDQVASNQWSTNRIAGFYVKNNAVKIYPYGLGGYTLRMYFYRRPNQLVQTSKAGQVLTKVGNDITLSFLPPDWVNGDSVCAISQLPGFDARFDSQTISNVSSPGLTLEDASDVEVGDWICLENESTIPQILPEAHGLLAQITGTKMLLSMGAPGAEQAENMYKIMERDFIEMITPRVDNAPKKIVNRGSILNWTRVRRGLGYY